MPIIDVMGSGTDNGQLLTGQLRRFPAQRAAHLLTGGSGGGTASVSRAFYETTARRDLVIGILPSLSPTPPSLAKTDNPNPWVAVPMRTHRPFSSEQGTNPLVGNHINILRVDAVIALAGGPGTRSEIKLAARYQRPNVALVTPVDHSYRNRDIPHIHKIEARTEHFASCLDYSKSGKSPRDRHHG